jgi:hypothetical protein
LYPERWPPLAALRPPVELRDDWFRLNGNDDTVLGNFPSGRFPPGFPTHGHCDFTSFSWLHGGAPVLVDRGRYRYTADPVSLSQASAASHNLPTVNGFAPLCESLVVNGQWWPSPYAAATLEAGERNGGLWLAHSGFARTTPVARHLRAIRLCDPGLLVEDIFEGRGSVELVWYWNIGPGFDRFDEAQRPFSVSGPSGRLLLAYEGLNEVPSVAVLRGDSPGGWMSAEYDQKEPALALRLEARVSLPLAVKIRFDVRLTAAGVRTHNFC